MKQSITMIAVHLRENILLTTIPAIKNAEDIQTAKGLTNYAMGAADTIIEISNTASSGESDAICYYGIKTKYDVLQALVETANRLKNYETAFKAASQRDEAWEELRAMEEAA